VKRKWLAVRRSLTAVTIELAVAAVFVGSVHAGPPEWQPPFKPNKLPRAMKGSDRQGYIGLPEHGRAAWYRNIRVARLD
jgi:hypothetical protein